MRSSWAGVMAGDSSWWWVSLGSCHLPLEVTYVYSGAEEFLTLGPRSGMGCPLLTRRWRCRWDHWPGGSPVLSVADQAAPRWDVGVGDVGRDRHGAAEEPAGIRPGS